MPKTRMKRVTKEKYIDTCWMFDVPSGLKPYRIDSDCGRIDVAQEAAEQEQRDGGAEEHQRDPLLLAGQARAR